MANHTLSRLITLLAGVLFGSGLTLSGMVNPAKVLGFLDVAGNWDPSLGLVMAGAIPLAAVGYAVARRRPTPLCAPHFDSPNKHRVDGRLVVGAGLFGVGWGLVGLCPGPVVAALGIASLNGPLPSVAIFALAMVAGMAAFRLFVQVIKP